MGRFGTSRIVALAAFTLCLASIACGSSAYAQSDAALQQQINAHQQEIDQLNKEIAQYEAEIQKAGADKKTLQAAIDSLDLQKKKVQTQINATQTQIASTQLQIRKYSDNIASTQSSIDANQASLAAAMRDMQQADAQPLIARFFGADDLASAWTDLDRIVQVQGAVQDHVQALQQEEQQLAEAKNASQQKQDELSSQKRTLTSQRADLTQTSNAKSELLVQTDAKQSQYEKLLEQAKAELASFSKFAQNAGGTGLLTNQTSCDSWGCYYNQRDAQWGNDPLNGTKYALKSDGCLITAMAMVFTHYGYIHVTPVTINANPANFASYYPAYLLFTITADGASATRKRAAIDATLATGNPVIVGIYAYGGTHYVVLTSGRNGHYLMRDPYIANGKDISFTAHYALKNIFSVQKVVITG